MKKLTHLALRQSIIDTCLEMTRLGINQGTSGNVSVRMGRGFLITPSGLPYEEMQPGHIVEMDLEGKPKGDILPSSEWRMHCDIYRARPDAGAVIHTHAAHCSALSCLRKDIPAFHYMIAVAGGTDIRCAPYATFGTQKLSDNMLKALKGRKACLLANHGMICLEANLNKALWLAGEVESLARQYWLASQAGKPAILSDREMKLVLTKFQTYGQQQSQEDTKSGPSPKKKKSGDRRVRNRTNGKSR